MFHVKHYNEGMKAVLFDYNGTIYQDDDINTKAWKAVINELSQGKINADTFYDAFIGVRNYPFVEAIFKELNYPLEKDKIMYWATRKETEYYQKICKELNRTEMTAGAEKLLNYLKEKKIPINMCTASLNVNVDFYFELLNCSKQTFLNRFPSARVCCNNQPSCACSFQQQNEKNYKPKRRVQLQFLMN